MEDRLKILVVDDDPSIRELMQVYLEEEFIVIHAENGLEAIEKVQTDKPSLVLLDIMLPLLNGWEVCKQIRTFCQVPIIMVSAKGEEIDKILGLELGAEDYITKPFSPREVLARVKAQIRRSLIGRGIRNAFSDSTGQGNSIPDDSPDFTGLHINLKKYQVFLNGLEVELTAKEFDLLAFLTQNRGQVFTREQLLNKVWGFDYFGDTRAVDSAIKRLRKKINNEEKNHIFIPVRKGQSQYFQEPVIRVIIPIIQEDRVIGAIILYSPIHGINKALASLSQMVLTAGIISLAIAFLIGIILSRRLSRPILTLHLHRRHPVCSPVLGKEELYYTYFVNISIVLSITIPILLLFIAPTL